MIDRRMKFPVGGAILPGLRSQFRALHDHTDQLPSLDLDLAHWPQRWATDTAGAIASGILHTQLAGIRDFIQAWAADWPGGAVVLTGGDSATIHHYLTQQPPAQRCSWLAGYSPGCRGWGGCSETQQWLPPPAFA